MSHHGTKTLVDEIEARLDTCEEVDVDVETRCCWKTEWYMLSQAFAIVRHAHRLDHTAAWDAFPDRNLYPNDTSLSEEGFAEARRVADVMKREGTRWKLIISSPYFRCAQTASCIADKLNIPIRFDLDLGEVFDQVSMIGDCTGRPQHRPADVLEEKLRPDFPNVEYIRDANGSLRIDGKLQHFPEAFDGARVRYCYKVQKLLQQAAADLASVLIVTHGDAISSVLGLMEENWIIEHIPIAAYVIGQRRVRVLKKGSNDILTDEPVYGGPEPWQLKLHPGIHYYECSTTVLVEANKLDMMEMKTKKTQVKQEPSLEAVQRESIRSTLVDMQASQEDLVRMLSRTSTKSFGAGSRIACHPDHINRVSVFSNVSKTQSSLNSENEKSH